MDRPSWQLMPPAKVLRMIGHAEEQDICLLQLVEIVGEEISMQTWPIVQSALWPGEICLQPPRDVVEGRR